MTYEQLEELFTPIYILLACILIALTAVMIIKTIKYLEQENNIKDKQITKQQKKE